MNSVKTNTKRFIILAILMVALSPAMAQQQAMYSQYMFNMMNINPAYAGSRGVMSTTALFRDQWVGMAGAPVTASVSLDMPLRQKRIGLGLQLYSDKLGVEQTTGLNVSYAYRIQMTASGSLSFGLQAGLLNYKANYTDVSVLQPGDPSFYQNVNGILPAAGAGIYYNSDKFYIGASVPALLKTKLNATNKADVAFAGSDLHFFFATGGVFSLNDDLALKPSILVKAVSGAPLEADLNANLWIQNTLAIGASYRTGDAVVGMVEWQVNQQLRFGYAYDKAFTNLGMYNQGTHELMLRMEFGSSNGRIVSPRYF